MDMGTHSRTQLERDRNTCGHTVTDTWTHMDRDRWTPRLTHGNTNIDGCRHRYTETHTLLWHSHMHTFRDTGTQRHSRTQGQTNLDRHKGSQRHTDMCTHRNRVTCRHTDVQGHRLAQRHPDVYRCIQTHPHLDTWIDTADRFLDTETHGHTHIWIQRFTDTHTDTQRVSP